MSATNSLHYQLCCEGAKWLRNKKNRERWRGHWKYIWVEPGLIGENPDIWAFNGDDTICIEVKTSHADFMADRKKWWRRGITWMVINWEARELRYARKPEYR